MSGVVAGLKMAARVGGVLRSLREIRGLSQSEVAEAAGLKQGAWSKIERGLTPATVEHLAHAAQKLGVKPSYILTLAESWADNEVPA